jgi:hypothetical protein
MRAFAAYCLFNAAAAAAVMTVECGDITGLVFEDWPNNIFDCCKLQLEICVMMLAAVKLLIIAVLSL